MKLGYSKNGDALYYDGDIKKFEELIDIICSGLCELDTDENGDTYGIDIVDFVGNTQRFKWMYRSHKENVFGLKSEVYGTFLNNLRCELLDIVGKHFMHFHTMTEQKVKFLNESKVILLDGCDCAGKNTLAKALKRELTTSDMLVRVIESPDYTNTLAGITLKCLLSGKYKISTLGKVISALMVFDRLETFSMLFGQHVETLDEVIFILDRGYTSNVLYADINKVDIREAMTETLTLELRHMPKPNLFFLCYPKNEDEVAVHKTYLDKRAKEIGLDKNEKDYSMQEGVVKLINFACDIDTQLFHKAHKLGMVTEESLAVAIKMAKEKFPIDIETGVRPIDNK